jgi:hypothetical protein
MGTQLPVQLLAMLTSGTEIHRKAAMWVWTDMVRCVQDTCVTHVHPESKGSTGFDHMAVLDRRSTTARPQPSPTSTRSYLRC